MFAWLRSRPRLLVDDFHALLAEKSARWYGACLRITGDAGLAEDAVQDALLKAWDKRAEFRGEADLDTWIHRIAINAAIDLSRKRRGDVLEATADAADPGESGPAEAHAVGELGEGLERAMRGLTDLERQCFVLKHLEQWRLIEIAEQLQTSQDSIKQALFRALRKLRVTLEPWRSEA
ncbi:MAG: sigma-70 family RNA polymerase sigma factor [Xanthomonadales bacterium]|nr:sigma-70 family RNA polymerase sigma factor [Xanthomonadales bacterium]